MYDHIQSQNRAVIAVLHRVFNLHSAVVQLSFTSIRAQFKHITISSPAMHMPIHI